MPGVDTENKRRAAIMAGIPFIVIAPVADGTIGATDRQHISHVYGGIAATTPATPAATTAEVMHGMMRMIRYVKTKLMPYGSMYID